MSRLLPDHSDEVAESRIVRKGVAPSDVPEQLVEPQAKATISMWGRFWAWLQGRTPETAEWALREGIRRVETDNDIRAAEAEKTVAEAAEKYAVADATRRQAAIDERRAEAEADERKANAERTRAEAALKRAEAAHKHAEALDRVAKAISAIKQKGGDVHFEPDDIMRLLGQSDEQSDETD